MLLAELCVGAVWGMLVDKGWNCARACMLSQAGWMSVCKHLILFIYQHGCSLCGPKSSGPILGNIKASNSYLNILYLYAWETNYQLPWSTCAFENKQSEGQIIGLVLL